MGVIWFNMLNFLAGATTFSIYAQPKQGIRRYFYNKLKLYQYIIYLELWQCYLWFLANNLHNLNVPNPIIFSSVLLLNGYSSFRLAVSLFMPDVD